jgi:hypothetical protein
MNEETETAEYELKIESGTWYFDQEYCINNMKRMFANYSDHDMEMFEKQLGTIIHV